MSLAQALLLLAQVGPSPTPLNLPTGLEDRPRRTAPAAPAPVIAQTASRTPFSECLDAIKVDPPAAAAMAEDWIDKAKGPELAQAQFCLGSAKAAVGNWDEAEAAFVAGRDAAAPANKRLRAQLGAMAGTAALVLDAPERALGLLDQAHGDAIAAPDARLAGDIQVDRSRALVSLKRAGEAATALVEARTASAENAEAWLLSATLARREGKLDEAQGWIERAAALAPRDPQVGLEAGVIAVLAGRDEAARKSWQSVIAAAPDSDLAKAAQGYLDQLAAAPAPATPTAAAK
jgi:tetratricopeptide (TPR) repeat protein